MRSSRASLALTGLTMTALMGIGLSAHVAEKGPLDWASLLDGSAQSQYTADFDKANPYASFAINAVGAVKYALFRQASAGAVVGTKGWLFTAEELEVTPDFDTHLGHAADVVAQQVQALGLRNITVLPVIIPDKSEVYAEALRAPRPQAVAKRLAKFTAALKARGITYLDASGALNAAKAEKDVFLKDDTHWSPHGSRAVAQAIAAALAKTQVTRQDVQIAAMGAAPFDGDLLRFVPTGAFREALGPAQQQIDMFNVEISGTAGLFGDPVIDIALVGTSFSARAEWQFETFLKHAFQADLVNFAQEGQGPFAPMEAFMASEFLQNTPPRIVIWEIPARYLTKDMNQ